MADYIKLQDQPRVEARVFVAIDSRVDIILCIGMISGMKYFLRSLCGGLAFAALSTPLKLHAATLNSPYYTTLGVTYAGQTPYYSDGTYLLQPEFPLSIQMSSQTTGGNTTAVNLNVTKTVDTGASDGAFPYGASNGGAAILTAQLTALHVFLGARSAEFIPQIDGTNQVLAGPLVSIGGSESSNDTFTMIGPSNQPTLQYAFDFFYRVDSAVGQWYFNASLNIKDNTGTSLVSISKTTNYQLGGAGPTFEYESDIAVSNGAMLTETNILGGSVIAGTDGYSDYGTLGQYGYLSQLDASNTSYFTITPLTPGASYIAASGTIYDGSGVELPEPLFMATTSCGIVVLGLRRRRPRATT